MWIYEKKLQYPVRVDTTNPALAQMIIEQFGGADGSYQLVFAILPRDGLCQLIRQKLYLQI